MIARCTAARAVLALLGFVPAVAAQAPPVKEPEGVTLRLAGQRGGARFRPGAPLPFAADIGVPRAASGEGRLEIVRLPGPGEAEHVLWTGELTIAPGGVHRTTGLAAAPDGSTMQIEARWTSGGRTFRSLVPTTPVEEAQRWVWAVADVPESAAALGAVRPADGPGDWLPPWVVSLVDLSLLPPGWTAFAAADAVAVTCPVADLDDGVLVGLTRFVEAGGTLLIGGGDRAAAIAAALPGLSPVAPGAATATPIAPLARRFSRNATSGDVLAAAATPAAGDVVMGGRDRALLVVADRGAGQTAWLAFDPGESRARDGGVASRVLEWLLARRDDVTLRRGLADADDRYQVWSTAVTGGGTMRVTTRPGQVVWSVTTSAGGRSPATRLAGAGNPFAAPLEGLEIPTPGRAPVVWAGAGWCLLVIAVLWTARRRHRLGVGWAGLAAGALAVAVGTAWWAESAASSILAARSFGLAVGALGAKSAALVESTALRSPVGVAAPLEAEAPVESCGTVHGWQPPTVEPVASGARARIELPARSPVRVVSSGLLDLGDGVTVEFVRETEDGLTLRVRNGTPFDLDRLVVATAGAIAWPRSLPAGASLETELESRARAPVAGWLRSTEPDASRAAESLIAAGISNVEPGTIVVSGLAQAPVGTLRLAGRSLAIDGRCVLALHGPLPPRATSGRALQYRAVFAAACDPNDPTDTDLSAYSSVSAGFLRLGIAGVVAPARHTVAATLSALQFQAGVAFDLDLEVAGDVPFDQDLAFAPAAVWERGRTLEALAANYGWTLPAAAVQRVLQRDPVVGRWIERPIVDGVVRLAWDPRWLRGRRLSLRVCVTPAFEIPANVPIQRGVLSGWAMPPDDVLKVSLDRLALVPSEGEKPR